MDNFFKTVSALFVGTFAIVLLISVLIGIIAVSYFIGIKYGPELGWASLIIFFYLGHISNSLSSLENEVKDLKKEYKLSLYRNSEKLAETTSDISKILDSSERIESLIFDTTLELKK